MCPQNSSASTEDNRTPLVSIVLPTHNGGRYLQQSIDSCLAQTWRNVEVVLVDDGSTDAETARVLQDQTDPRVRVFRLNPNVGLPEALNAGFGHARGELLTWTSDDNLFRPRALETMAREILQGGAEFVYADATAIDDAGRETGPLPVRDPEHLIVENCIGPCWLFTRRVLRTVGDFDPGLRLVEDYDYWVRVYKAFPMRRLDENLYLYRFHGDTLTARHGGERVRALVEQVRRAHFPRWRLAAVDGVRALDRGDRPLARRLLAGALLRRFWAWKYYRPAALAWLPESVVQLLVRLKKRLRPSR